MARKYSIWTVSTHRGMRREGGGMAKMPNFLINMVDLSSETSHGASNSTDTGRAPLYKSEIDDNGE